jgi:hypothetical protein
LDWIDLVQDGKHFVEASIKSNDLFFTSLGSNSVSGRILPNKVIYFVSIQSNASDQLVYSS